MPNSQAFAGVYHHSITHPPGSRQNYARGGGELRPIAMTMRRGDHSSLIHSDSRATTFRETIGGAPVDGGLCRTRVIVTELPVLVVGCGTSGFQLGVELARSDRDVTVAGIPPRGFRGS